jgi:hypothetical protein
LGSYPSYTEQQWWPALPPQAGVHATGAGTHKNIRRPERRLAKGRSRDPAKKHTEINPRHSEHSAQGPLWISSPVANVGTVVVIVVGIKEEGGAISRDHRACLTRRKRTQGGNGREWAGINIAILGKIANLIHLKMSGNGRE